MGTSIVTWNTQGRPDTATDKNVALKALCQTYDVVLLQECGRLFERHGETIAGKTIYCYEQAGALNPRCSVAIIAGSVTGHGVNSHSSTGRPLIWVRRGDMHIATIHATSGGVGLPDVKAGLRYMAKEVKSEAFVLGGDFNVTMDSETTELNIGTAGRPDTFEIASQDRPTHSGGGILDSFATHNVDVIGKPRVGRPTASDHRYLTATFRAR